jgi:hypothetical protein
MDLRCDRFKQVDGKVEGTMNFIPGDMVFVLHSNTVHPHKPMIVMDSFTSPMFGLRYITLIDPCTGKQYEYQPQNLTRDPR